MPDEPIPAENPERGFGEGGGDRDTVPVDTGRGNIVNVPIGEPFQPTLERLADEANYGGFYRVYLNGVEVVDPEDSPPVIERDMRIAITSYDKVG